MDVIPLGGPYGLIAEIFHGDPEQPKRMWVCVRDVDSTGTAWIGCWSKSPEAGDGQRVEEILRELTEIAKTGAVRGPGGLVLNEHFFFEGWQSWGPGTPAPLKHFK